MMLYLILLTLFSNFHDFHVSRTEIEYDESRQKFEVSIHVFSDDVLSSLGIDDQMNADTLPQEQIKDYILNHFSLYSSGKGVQFDFVGIEETEDFYGVWCYFESDVVVLTDDHHVDIINDILVETYSDQSNLLNIKLPNQKSKYYIFNSGQTEKRISSNQ